MALPEVCHKFAAPQNSNLGLKKKMTPKKSVLILAIGRHLYLKVDRFAKMSELHCTKCPAKLLALFEPRFSAAKMPIKQWLGIFQQPF